MAGVPPLIPWEGLYQLGKQGLPYISSAYGLYKKIRSHKNFMKGSYGTGISKKRGNMKKLQAGEPRSIDTAVAMNCYSAANNGPVDQLALIPHDGTVHGRNGRRVLITGILVRGTVIAGTTQTLPHTVGFMIVQDKKPRGSIPATTDILESGNEPIRLPQNKQGAVRFRTLMRRVYMVQGDGDALTGTAPMYHVDEYRKLNFIMTFDDTDTTGSVSTLDENGLFFVMLGEGADSTASPRIDMNVRVYYRDID